YLDAPLVRYPGRRDIAALEIGELVLPGTAVDLTDAAPGEAIGFDRFLARLHGQPANRAVLCRFGWDRFWGTEAYFSYPFLSPEIVVWLSEKGACLVGVDTINIDDGADPARPAHTWLLQQEIFILENLCNLAALPAGAQFRLFAVPIKARGAGSMPIR